MRTIDNHFSLKAEKTLYHYTSVSALLGMVESRSIRASNIYFLNDSKEIVHACEVLQQVLRDRLKGNVHSDEETEFLSQLADWIESCKTTTYNVFIFSLSENASILSQWRSYTPHGKGVSIGVSTNTLNHIAQRYNLRIGRCIYERIQQKDIIKDLIDQLLITFNQQLSSIDTQKANRSQSYFPFLERFRGRVLQVLALIKDQAFKEEGEWRLISPYFARYTVPEILFREGASMLVPYIELSLGQQSPIFEEVILGPSQHQNLSMSALSMFLSNQEFCNVVKNCSIPYREW